MHANYFITVTILFIFLTAHKNKSPADFDRWLAINDSTYHIIYYNAELLL